MTKVFIGMPAYNGERFIREAIESVIGQSYADWVMLISDDASTDKTRAICEEYTKKDSRITYYRQEKNIGMFPNFKFLLDHADNEYFMWAAQDDMREPDYLGVCVKHLNENKDLGVTTTCTTLIDSKGEPVLNELELARLSGKPSFTSVAQYILQPEILGKCNLMYGVWRTEATRATWKAYPQRTTWGQDYILEHVFSQRQVAGMFQYIHESVCIFHFTEAGQIKFHGGFRGTGEAPGQTGHEKPSGDNPSQAELFNAVLCPPQEIKDIGKK